MNPKDVANWAGDWFVGLTVVATSVNVVVFSDEAGNLTFSKTCKLIAW